MILLYLDQNYLSGMVKRKPGFRELEPVLRAAVTRGAVAVPESHAHRLESEPRPDLPLLELVRELSGGLRLPDELGARERFYGRCDPPHPPGPPPQRRALFGDTPDVDRLCRRLQNLPGSLP